MLEGTSAIRAKPGTSIAVGLTVETVGGKSLGKINAFDKMLDRENHYAGVTRIRTDGGYALSRDDIIVERSTNEKLVVSLLRCVGAENEGEEDVAIKVTRFNSIVAGASRDIRKVVVLFEAIRLDSEIASLAIGRPSVLELADESGWTVADDIASYSQIDVVRELLDKAGVDGRVKQIINIPHKIGGNVAITTSAIAASTLQSARYSETTPVDLDESLFNRLHFAEE